MSVRIGMQAPAVNGDCVNGKGEFSSFSLEKITSEGKWAVIYFYPLDFTFVCPTEIQEFNSLAGEFANNNAVVAGVSIDSKFSHLAWLQSGTLIPGSNELKHPLVADLTKTISRDYGVLGDGGFAFRGTFIVDPAGRVRFYSCVDAPVGRSPQEILRTLQALQYADSHGGEVCPVNWKPGADTIKVG
ncbi:MAG: peroxiredoxin [Planctomycetes bacterium]|nr:peroxiredoxin [Planctomycetota bacterium]